MCVRVRANSCSLLPPSWQATSTHRLWAFKETYLRLRATCKRLEGSCRQMAHERGDDFTWLQAAHHYNKVSEAAQQLRKKGEWLRFGKLAEVFDASLPKVERLATIANGVTSLSTSPLLVLPPFLRPKVTAGGIIIPS